MIVPVVGTNPFSSLSHLANPFPALSHLVIGLCFLVQTAYANTIIRSCAKLPWCFLVQTTFVKIPPCLQMSVARPKVVGGEWWVAGGGWRVEQAEPPSGRRAVGDFHIANIQSLITSVHH